MTTAQTPDLLPCPFCGGGETIVQEGSKPFPRLKYRQPTSAAVMHRCTPSEDGLAHTVSLVGQDRASAIAAWNQRAELEARKPLPLSDEQIDDLHGEANRGFDIGREEYFKAFRDAERAHGITGGSS